jgi:hypothetical protein
MDQRPYPGPPLLFHVRMCILFVVLWSVDMVMFLIALDNTLAYGVGGMVLFASEVCHRFPTIGCLQHFSLLVWYLDGECRQLRVQIFSFCLRILPSWTAGWRECTSMGEQEYVGILRGTYDGHVCTHFDPCLRG